MKFHLTEPNKSISSKELIDDLLRVEKIVGGGSVTKAEYDKHGNYSYRTHYKRFGSWKNALRQANLHSNNQPWGGDIVESSIPKELLLEDLKSVLRIY